MSDSTTDGINGVTGAAVPQPQENAVAARGAPPGVVTRSAWRASARGRSLRPVAASAPPAKMRWIYTVQSCLYGAMGAMYWLHASPTDSHWLLVSSRWVFSIGAVVIGLQAGQAWRERFSQTYAARRQ